MADPTAFGGDGGLVRLNKYLADHGVASRRKCDELIVAGKVTVDGNPCVELGTKVDPARQTVEVDGVVLRPEGERLRYYLLNKPKGVVCTNDRREARTRAIDLITDPQAGRIYTVGRLDEDSTGLILLTNDGEFTNLIAHPRNEVPKTYLVKVRGKIDGEALERIRGGVHLAEGRTGAARVRMYKRTSTFSTLSITLHEGKNREVRRIFARVGFNVLALRRTRIANLSDRRLKEGQWRPLLRAEVQELVDVAHGVATVHEERGRGGAGGRKPRRPAPRGARGRAGAPRRDARHDGGSGGAGSRRPPSPRGKGGQGRRGGQGGTGAKGGASHGRRSRGRGGR